MFEFGSAQKSISLLSDVFYFICIAGSLTRLVVAQDHAVISAVQIQGGDTNVLKNFGVYYEVVEIYYGK